MMKWLKEKGDFLNQTGVGQTLPFEKGVALDAFPFYNQDVKHENSNKNSLALAGLMVALTRLFAFYFLFLHSAWSVEKPSAEKPSAEKPSAKNTTSSVTKITNAKPVTQPTIQAEGNASKMAKTPALPVVSSLPSKKDKTTALKTASSLYHLTIDYGEVNFTGQNKKTMLINGQLPAPTLVFKEGEKAVIHVTNKMDVDTSIHWHGILLPNFQDGVSYLTTPPIKPNTTHKFEFTLKQAGTYWYHSHTGLQEQRGLYGAIVVQPKKKQYQYDQDLVLVLSDWTDEDPMDVLRTLKKGSEWYALKKGSALSLWEVLKNKVFGVQLALWRQRMPGMDISDVYYDSFLINGQRKAKYPHFKAEEKIRLRVINASASTYFWVNFGGDPPLLISADGLNVKPLKVDKILHAVAETYDFLITIPQNKALQIKATAQDGTGFATALMGQGEVLKAPVIAKPDPIQEMRKMALMHTGDHKMDHGTHSSFHSTHHPPKEHNQSIHHPSTKKNNQTTHNMNQDMHHPPKEHNMNQNMHHPPKEHNMNQNMHKEKHIENKNLTTKDQKPSTNIPTSDGRAPNTVAPTKQAKEINHNPDIKVFMVTQSDQPQPSSVSHKHINTHQDQKEVPTLSADKTKQTESKSTSVHKHTTKHTSFSYNKLEALEITAFSNPHLKEIHLNLTGNMLRYIWSFNGRTLSQSDKIQIKKGETLRLHLHNKTMMHHPMHLHGHFFRVLNGAGEKAPLKHTVDVPPMQTVVIEFNPEEKGDWFFHCHILYHMKSGMSRVFSHGDQRDPRLKNYPLSKVFKGDRAWYGYGEVGMMTNRADIQSTLSNIRNKIALEGVFSWVDHRYNLKSNFEIDISYAYFFTDFFRVYGALELAKKHDHPSVAKAQPLFQFKNPEIEVNAKTGLRYLLPFFFELDLNIDNQLRLEIGLEYELLLFPWVEFFAEWEWKMDWGLVNSLSDGKIWANDFEWALGLHYILSKNLSVIASYDNRFSYGAGLTWKF